MAVDELLDPAPAGVHRVAREEDHVKGSITAIASGSSSVAAVLEAGEPVHRNHLETVAERLGLFRPASLERTLGAALQRCVVTYGIVTDSARSRVADVLAAVGSRVERSVFVIDVLDGTVDRVSDLLDAIINELTDSVHLFCLCVSCQTRVRALGQAFLPDFDDDCCVVI